jgi:hypothetical protein
MATRASCACSRTWGTLSVMRARCKTLKRANPLARRSQSGPGRAQRASLNREQARFDVSRIWHMSVALGLVDPIDRSERNRSLLELLCHHDSIIIRDVMVQKFDDLVNL